MTYSVLNRTGNLVDAFTERAPALECLATIARAEPEAAGEAHPVAQDATGAIVGETV